MKERKHKTKIMNGKRYTYSYGIGWFRDKLIIVDRTTSTHKITILK